MDYLDFGDTIDYNKFNALVYLLRKFKKLTSELELGAYDINTDYGNFHFTDGFVPVGNNWILEDNVTVTGSNVLLNSFYTFVFTVVDVNTSGVVNKRLVRVTSESTGETGTLTLSIPSDLIGTDEVILPKFTLEVVFDEHEYYTPLPDIHLSLSVDKRIIEAGEVATITGLLTDSTSTPIENVRLPLNVDGTIVTVITDSTGEFNYAYTSTGTRGKVLVSALGESVFFYDGLINIMGATVTGNNVVIGWNRTWLFTTGDVVIDWGDGTSDTVNNPTLRLSHDYTDGESEHIIVFDGTVTSLGTACFYNCSGLTSVTIPSSVTSLGFECFRGCSGLTSIVIPNSVTSLGDRCFYRCSGLIDYELYWETQPIPYDSTKMPVNNGTVFRIPYGTTSVYTDAGYPSARLVEREPLEPLDTTLSIASDKQTIYTDETVIITGTLLDEDNNPVKQASVKLYDGNTLLDTLTTDNLGAYSKTITGLTTGTHTLHTSFEGTSNYNASTSSNIIITVSEHNYNLVLSSDTPIIQKTETAVVNALLSIDGSAYSSQSLSYTVKHGSSVIDSGTLTTDSNGEASITYTGTGVGDVSVEVSYGTLLQETYELEDVNYYDDTLTDKSSNYATKLVSSITHSTDYYQVATTSSSTLSTYMSTVLIQNLTIPSHFKVTCEMMFPDITSSSGTHEIGVGLFETNGTSNNESMIDLMSNQNQKGLIVRNSWSDNRVSGKLSQDIWYTMELEYDGSVVTGTIYNGNSTVWTGTLSSTKTINNIGFCTLGRNSSYKFRKLKVKAL